MKIIHLSDTHLGYRQFHKIDPDTDVNQREQDVYDAFDSAINKIIELEPDLVLHAGDLFDTVRPSNRAVNQATYQFARLSREEIPTVVIAGNHDTPKMATTGTIMQSLDQLPGIHAVTSDPAKPEGGYRTVELGNLAVHAVADAPVSEQLVERLQAVQPSSQADWNILVLHAGVRVLQNQVYSGEFNEHYVSTELLESLGMDYVALGHYHKRMSVGERITAHYSGATERFSFNEAGYQPGFLELNLDEEIDITEHTVETRPFVRIDEIDAANSSVAELIEKIENQWPEHVDREETLFSLTVTNLDSTTRALLEEQFLQEFQEDMFESEIRLVGPEGEVTSASDLEFQDLRKEFENYLENCDLAEDEEAEAILTTAHKYLSRAIGEEDEV